MQKNSENLEVFPIEDESGFDVFLLDPTEGSSEGSKICGSCRIEKPKEYQK